MVRALIIGEDERAKIEELKAQAAATPTSYERGRQLALQREKGVFINIENDLCTITLPIGYRVTFTHEFQRSDVECRHMSVTISTPRKAPHPTAVEELMRLFGFVSPLRGAIVWLDDPPGEPIIINVVEPLDGDLRRLAKE